jgi:hypothetical protein
MVVSSINKTDHHNITEILLKVALNTITLTPYKCTFIYRTQEVDYIIMYHNLQNTTVPCYFLLL